MNKPTLKIYRTTNWSKYNQALINRGNISIWFDPKTRWYDQPKSKHVKKLPDPRQNNGQHVPLKIT